MFLETKRLVLREFSPEDFEDVHEYSSDYENVKHMVFGPNTPEQTREYLEVKCVAEREAQPRMHYNIALALKETGKVIGGISLHMNWRRDDAILGMVLNRHFAGCGYMTEGLTGILRIAFEQLGLHRVHAICDVKNPGAWRIMEKTGMRREGCLIRRGKSRPEEEEPYFDQYEYAILAEEFADGGNFDGNDHVPHAGQRY